MPMKKPVKIAVGVVAGVVVLLVVAVGVAAALFDANAFRGRITAEVKRATGRELVIDDLHVSVFPTLGARIKGARLGNAAGFGSEPFAQVADAEVGVRLLPLLLRREVQVGSVTLDGVQLNLAKNADGTGNWQDLSQPKPAPPVDQPQTPPAEKSGQGIRSIDIGGITVKNAQLVYADRQTNKTWTVSKLDLKTGAVHPGKPFDLDLSFTTAGTQPAITADTTLSARVSLDTTAKVYDAAGIKLKLVASGAGVPAGKQTLGFSGDARCDGAKGSFKLASGEITLADLVASISLDGSGLGTDAMRARGPLQLKPFAPRALLKTLGVEPKTADANVLKSFGMRATLDMGANAAQLEDIDAKLDETTLTGSAGLRDTATQAIEFALKVDRFDADRYLPPKTTPSASPGQPASASKPDNALLPTGALEGITASGTFDIGSLTLSNLRMSQVQLRVALVKNAEKRIELSSKLYEGTLAATTRIGPGAKPTLAQSAKLVSISAGPLLKDLNGKDSLTGQGSFNLDIASGGNTMAELKRQMDGTVNFAFSNGAVKGFNLGQILRRGQALLGGQTFDDNAPQETDFSTLSGGGQITNGVLKSDNLDAKSPLFRLGGAGTVDLAGETIDYVAKPVVVNTATGQGGKELAQLAGIVIPIHVTGSFAQPKYQLDLKAALEQQATEKLRGRLDEQMQKKLGVGLDSITGGKPDDKLNQKLNEGLGKLFGRKNEPPKDDQKK